MTYGKRRTRRQRRAIRKRRKRRNPRGEAVAGDAPKVSDVPDTAGTETENNNDSTE